MFSCWLNSKIHNIDVSSKYNCCYIKEASYEIYCLLREILESEHYFKDISSISPTVDGVAKLLKDLIDTVSSVTVEVLYETEKCDYCADIYTVLREKFEDILLEG